MGATKRCPYCGEEILAAAKKCRYCGKWLDCKDEPETVVNETSRQEKQRFKEQSKVEDHIDVKKKQKIVWLLAGIGMCLVVTGVIVFMAVTKNYLPWSEWKYLKVQVKNTEMRWDTLNYLYSFEQENDSSASWRSAYNFIKDWTDNHHYDRTTIAELPSDIKNAGYNFDYIDMAYRYAICFKDCRRIKITRPKMSKWDYNYYFYVDDVPYMLYVSDGRWKWTCADSD